MGSYLDAADAGLAVAETKLRTAQGPFDTCQYTTRKICFQGVVSNIE